MNPPSPTGRRAPALLAGVVDDLKALPSDELRAVALRLLLEIEAGQIAGHPLDKLSHVGDLSDCFKVYFDHPRGDRPAYRLVYRLNPDRSVTAAHIQAVAIGRRETLEVYRVAVRRLDDV